jgi:hypothetical protein
LSLTAQVEDLTQTNAVAKAEIARLTLILRTLRRGRFGKSSEKLDTSINSFFCRSARLRWVERAAQSVFAALRRWGLSSVVGAWRRSRRFCGHAAAARACSQTLRRML